MTDSKGGGYGDAQEDDLWRHRLKPLDHKTIYDALYKALERVGIPEAGRRERNITFHSWRHFLNTRMRGRSLTPSCVE